MEDHRRCFYCALQFSFSVQQAVKCLPCKSWRSNEKMHPNSVPGLLWVPRKSCYCSCVYYYYWDWGWQDIWAGRHTDIACCSVFLVISHWLCIFVFCAWEYRGLAFPNLLLSMAMGLTCGYEIWDEVCHLRQSHSRFGKSQGRQHAKSKLHEIYSTLQ
jgi:hypothetical protein